MLGFVLVTIFFAVAIYGISKIMDYKDIKENWSKYRCRPDVMFMADFYGHSSGENFEYCLSQGFTKNASKTVSPFYTYLSQFVTTLLTLLSSLNSIRLTFATLVGSVSKTFSDFSNRFKSLFFNIQTKFIRLRYLMDRVFATMFSVIFMGMSGIKATTNFGNTFLFQFLDTFCFDPDTPVLIKKKGLIPIKNVVIGDVFQKTNDIVTSTFSFIADGQEMVKLGDVLVSTNHYLLHEGKWIMSVDHPDAVKAGEWNGGVKRPLICLNTSSHSFPVSSYIFRDYDETPDGDIETMNTVDKQLNGTPTFTQAQSYDTCCYSSTLIKMKNGTSIPASSICLGDELSFGTVIGLVKKECNEVCVYKESLFTPGTCIWDSDSNSWKRAADLAFVQLLSTPRIFYSFVVSPSASIETDSGIVFRDYVEVHSPDTEKAYSSALAKEEC
jgi:hypothetical protein